MSRSINRHLLLLAFLLAAANFAAAQAPFLRVSVAPAKAIVGQPVRVTVDVLVPNFFTGAPDFPQFELENAIVVLSEETPQHINLTSNGVFFAGIRRSYTLYPEQAGTFSLPPASIRVPYAAHPPETAEATLTLPPRQFEAAIPPQAQGLDYFLPTTALHLTQKWNTSFNGLKAGDTLERTITITTARMQAMFIPPLPLDAPDGIRIYPQNPSVEDQKTDRGEFLQGRRVQRATYLIEKQGEYKLPAIEIRWWDLSANKLRTSALPPITITAAANPGYEVEIPPEAAPVAPVPKKPGFWHRYRNWFYALLPVALLLSIIAWLCVRYAGQLTRYWRARNAARENSERAIFRRLREACQENRAHDAYQYFLQWLTRARPEQTVQQFLDQSDDPNLTIEFQNLTASLYSDPALSWSGERLLKTLKRHRYSAAALRSYKRLPALNPTGR